MEKERRKIAVFPAGSEIGLEIHNALKYSTFLTVFGLTGVSNHAEYVFENYINEVPLITEPNFFEVFNEILDKYEIDYIFPALDDVQLFLVKNKEKVRAQIISPSLETVEVCRSKRKTYEFFAEDCFVPETYVKKEIKQYPVFIKPDIGQGSQGAKLIKNEKELDVEISKGIDLVLCENLPGDEFTIDCFTNAKGELLSVTMRNRRRVRNGISVSSEVLETPDEVMKIAQRINSRLDFKGVWFFQLKKDKREKFKLLEIAARVAGTMGVSRNTGTNYPLMTVFLFMGYDVKPIRNKYAISVDRALFSRFKTDINYDTVYVDLDDTLIVNGKVNTLLMSFLYQSKDNQKKIVLITKHKTEPSLTLKRFHVDVSLFDEIIWLKDGEDKAKHIVSLRSVFIDDSFTERLNVHNQKQIPVFDCSEVESLIDWRM